MPPLIGITCMGIHHPDTDTPWQGIKIAYVNAVRMAKGTPFLIPLFDDEASLETIWEQLDGLLLSGGGDISPEFYDEEVDTELLAVDPLRDQNELWMARRAMGDDMPLLAICRGMQVLNVAAGGSLYQDIAGEIPTARNHRCCPPEHQLDYLAHVVQPQIDSLLARIIRGGDTSYPPPTLHVNSRHHQALKEIGEGLVTVARSPDGIIEAIESPRHRFILGVQWHPEDLLQHDHAMRHLFEGLVQAAAEGRIKR